MRERSQEEIWHRLASSNTSRTPWVVLSRPDWLRVGIRRETKEETENNPSFPPRRGTDNRATEIHQELCNLPVQCGKARRKQEQEKLDQETCFKCALALLFRNMLKNLLIPFEGHHPYLLLIR